MVERPLFHGVSKDVVVYVLAFVGGFVDAVGYLELFQLFTSSITGNVVAAATALFRHNGGVFARIFITLLFALGGFITTLVAHIMRDVYKATVWDIGMVSVAQEIGILVVAAAVGIVLDTSPEGIPTVESWQCILIGSIMAVSMGMQSAAAVEMVKDSPSTTVMTANITKTSRAAAGAVHAALQGRAKPPDAPESKGCTGQAAKFAELFLLIVVFVVGAVVGAVLSLHTGFWSLLVPVAMLMAVLVSIYLAKLQHRANTTYGSVETAAAAESGAQMSEVANSRV
jgi:uncharacterized membrane protein YoaK (UPF0700 family)